ncbi:MAG: DUF6359 domain-containing protein [Paludibacter sp.]|jgi:hypothetical protein|nr:DUF6359 domain-containing protein [Paludibacter sp.]
MKLKHLFLAVAILPLLFSCEPDVTVTGIAVDKTSVTLTEVGQTDTLVATVVPANAKVNVTWKSSNTAVATVTGDGMTAVITAVGDGTAKISATTDIFSAECTVTVTIGGGSTGGDGDGTEAKPYNTQQLLDMKKNGTLPNKDEGTAKYWVEAYIVGSYVFANNPQFVIGTTPADENNVLLAAKADNTDTYSVISIKLGNFANLINLSNNPFNMGKKLKVYGVVEAYCGISGVVKIEKAYLNGTEVVLQGLDDVPVTDNMTSKQAYDAAASLKPDAKSSAEATVYGYVTSIKEVYTDQYKNITFYMNDTNGGADLFYAYRVKGTDAASIKVGDRVKVKAKLTNYKGNTPETVSGGSVEIVK